MPVDPPPGQVLDAFGVSAAPEPLSGGQRQVWRSGEVVLKPLDVSVEELRWRAHVLAALDGARGLRVAPPVRSLTGELVVDGWTAWRYEPGAAPRVGQYEDVIAAGRVLHHHLARFPRPPFLERRDHPWAVADRVAWDEQAVDDDGARLPHVRALLDVRRPFALPAQLVHGDLTDNVHLHPDLPPLVLDLTPYGDRRRTRRRWSWPTPSSSGVQASISSSGSAPQKASISRSCWCGRCSSARWPTTSSRLTGTSSGSTGSVRWRATSRTSPGSETYSCAVSGRREPPGTGSVRRRP